MKANRKGVVLLWETFTFGGLENYMLSVKQMCEEEGLQCWLVSIQKCDRADVISLSGSEFLNVRFPMHAYSLIRLLRILRPALVHSQSLYSLLLSSLLKSVLGYRTVCTIHNPFSVTEKPGLRRKLLPVILNPDALVGVSKESLHETLSHFKIRTRNKSVIYNWVDTERFSPGERRIPHQVLFVGRLDSQKRIEVLPNLARSLRNDIPELILHVCGDGPRSHLVKGMKGIRFHGRANDDTLLRLLQESALLVLPTKFEGMPLVILESLACGTPVVASPVGGIPGIAEISYGCFLADDNNFAGTVKHILKEDLDHRRIRSEAVKNFSYMRGKEELLDLYESLIGTS